MKNKKEAIPYMIIMGVCAALALGIGIYAVVALMTKNSNVFVDHFSAAVVMCSIGVIAILLPIVNGNKSRYAGDNSKDSFVMIAGVLLFLLGLLSIPLTYMGILNF